MHCNRGQAKLVIRRAVQTCQPHNGSQFDPCLHLSPLFMTLAGKEKKVVVMGWVGDEELGGGGKGGGGKVI